MTLKIAKLCRNRMGLMLWALSALLVLGGPGQTRAEKAVPETPKLSLAAGICLNKANTLADQGKLTDAIQTLKTFVIESGKGDHPYVYFSLGNFLAMAAAENPDKAAVQEGSEALTPDALTPDALTPDVLTPDALNQEAIVWYEKAVAADPAFSEAWLNLARCAYEAEAYKAAAKGFEQGYAHAKAPQAVHLYYAAVCRFQSDQSEQALALFETLARTHPRQVTLAWKEVWVNVLFSLDRYQKALPLVEELADKAEHPRKKKWQEILLQQYLNLDMDKKALAFALTLTREDPLEPKWWKALAHLRLKTGTGEKAQAKALADLMVYGYLSPMTVEEKQLVGDLCLSLEIPEKAAGIYGQILDREIKDGGKVAFNLLEKQAQALVMAHLPEQALKVINQALDLHGKKGAPGKDLVRLKQDLEQIIAYRNGLRAYNEFDFMTGRDLSGTRHNKKETP